METHDKETKKLNLVYTNWDGDTFIPNGYDLLFLKPNIIQKKIF